MTNLLFACNVVLSVKPAAAAAAPDPVAMLFLARPLMVCFVTNVP
jgi:hypothetical protein